MSIRLDRLRAKLQEKELDAILISTPENRRYLSGFTGSAGYLLISQAQAVLCTDFRYVEQSAHQVPEFRVERIGSSLDWLPRLSAELGTKKIGFESQNMTVATYQAFIQAINESPDGHKPALVSTSGVAEMLRALKDEAELRLLRRAVEMADQAFEEVAATIEPGITEQEVAWRLEKAMRERGAESIAFDIIVASGPNAALPHHRAGDKAITPGEPIVIDMGAKYMGYCSDMTRTVVLGQADETFRRVYDTVLGAQLTAEATVEAGMTGGDADGLARQIIQDAGYGDNFGHSLGHGIGLAVHEYPRVGPNSESVLEDGMVFTVEPGVYISGWGGVRIEDMVVMENGRARVLSKAHKRENPTG